MSIKIRNHNFSLNIHQTIAITFFSIILIGALLLTLPFATKEAGSCGFLTGLFTATSAVCVTGLSLVDIYSTFTLFGQIVILTMIELGGLGFMSIVSILFSLTNHHNSLQSLSLIAESVGSDVLNNITRIQKRLLFGSAIFESVGAIILTIAFSTKMKLSTALWFGIFHSVSAFCNAGFDLMGFFPSDGSLTHFQNDPLVLLTLSFLIIIGGLGFMVWDNILTTKSIKKLSVYTKLVLIASGILLSVGTVLFFIFEYNNPNTIGNMSLSHKLLNAFFQSVSPRTAGFAAISQNKFNESSIVLTMFLMFVGGSAGSTAGGVKTVTLLIFMKVLLSSIIGKRNLTVFHRSISHEQVAHVYTIINSFIVISLAGAFVLNLSSNVGFMASWFESLSALTTSGLSLGVTDSLNLLSKILLIMFMFIGRVGLLTLTSGFVKIKESPDIKYPSVRIMLG